MPRKSARKEVRKRGLGPLNHIRTSSIVNTFFALEILLMDLSKFSTWKANKSIV